MNTNDALVTTHSQIVSFDQTGFLPVKDIHQDRVLREDYEKLRINYELQRDIGSEL